MGLIELLLIVTLSVDMCKIALHDLIVNLSLDNDSSREEEYLVHVENQSGDVTLSDFLRLDRHL